MQKERKLISNLRLLGKEDFQDFVNFTDSPYFNTQPKPKQLLTLMAKRYPVFEAKHCADTLIYSLLFPGENFNENKLNKIYSTLGSLLETFAGIEQFLKEKEKVQLESLRFFEDNNNQDLATKIYEDLRLAQEVSDSRDQDYHFMRFQLDSIAYAMEMRHDKRKGSVNIQEMSDSFDRFTAMVKLQHYQLMRSRVNMFNTQFDFGIKDLLINYLEERKFLNSPEIEVLYAAHLFLEHPDSKVYYDRYRQLLFQHLDLFTHVNLFNLLNVLQSASHALFSDTHAFLQNLFEIYRFQIDRNLMVINKMLQPAQFSNVITVALSLHEFDFVERFLLEHGDYLPEESMEDYICYSLARLAFFRGQYEKAMNLLNKLKLQDTDIKLGARCLQLKTYFELGEFHVLTNQLATFKIYVHRLTGLNDTHRDMHVNFVNTFGRLLKTAQGGSLNSVKKLQQYVREHDALIDKAWFVEKCQQLEQQLVS